MKKKLEETSKETQKLLSEKGLVHELDVTKQQVAEASLLFFACLLSRLTLATIIKIQQDLAVVEGQDPHNKCIELQSQLKKANAQVCQNLQISPALTSP